MKRIVTNIISLLMLLVAGTTLLAQVQLGRQVIGSAGGTSTAGNIILSSTVGEPATQTLTANSVIILTQGFQQTYRTNDSLSDFVVGNESCPGANNGFIQINSLQGCEGPYLIQLDSGEAIPNGELVLASGNYDLIVTGGNGCQRTLSIFVGLDSDISCVLKFYSGITPNGDGENDTWVIDNIEQFPDNKVQIYNRWGIEVWVGTGYNNQDVVWSGDNKSGTELTDGTYFYVATVLGEKYNGWVEVTR